MKIRLSYTIVNLWIRGELEELARTILHLPRETSQNQLNGLEFEKMVFDTVKREKRLPEALGGLKMASAEIQKKIVVSYNSLADLVGVMDLYDGNEQVIYEIKYSKSSSADWLNTPQLPFYFLLCTMAGLKVKKGIVYSFNPSSSDYDTSILYFSQRKVLEAKNIIDSLLPEIYDFISSIPIGDRAKI